MAYLEVGQSGLYRSPKRRLHAIVSVHIPPLQPTPFCKIDAEVKHFGSKHSNESEAYEGKA